MPLSERSGVLFILLLQVLDIRGGRVDLVGSGHNCQRHAVKQSSNVEKGCWTQIASAQRFHHEFVRVVFLCAAIEDLHRAII